MNILFISDFYQEDLAGGAEMNDSVLIDHLQTLHKVEKVKSIECKVSDIKESDFVIVSNFVGLSHTARQALILKKNYIIYEHDHKYVSNRDPSKFKDFKIPESFIVNREFYKSAKKVFCLSSIQQSIIRENLNINNLENISCSLWSNKRLKLIEKLSDTPKSEKFAVVRSSNPIKNTDIAIRLCSEKNIDFDLISSDSQEQFLKILSGYSGLVFVPGVLESLCRLVVEAKMLNCKVLTTPKMLGAAYEPWFNLSGKDLISVMSKNNSAALSKFDREIQE